MSEDESCVCSCSASQCQPHNGLECPVRCTVLHRQTPHTRCCALHWMLQQTTEVAAADLAGSTAKPWCRRYSHAQRRPAAQNRPTCAQTTHQSAAAFALQTLHKPKSLSVLSSIQPTAHAWHRREAPHHIHFSDPGAACCRRSCEAAEISRVISEVVVWTTSPQVLAGTLWRRPRGSGSMVVALPSPSAHPRHRTMSPRCTRRHRDCRGLGLASRAGPARLGSVR